MTVLPKAHRLYARVSRLIKPTTRTTPDEWARQNRIYPPTAGVPGPRDPSLTPYIVAPTRAVHARTHKRVALVCGSQMGKSDGALDIIGERFDTAPVPTLYLGPTKQFLQDQWEPRVMDLLDGTKALRGKVARGKRMKVLRKLISGVPLRLAHGGSSTALKSDPFGLALTDEADELMANVKGAGDPIRLVDRRGDTYADFVHYITSTPSEGPSDVEVDPESGLEFWAEIDPQEISSTIWRIWQSGTRYHWAWPCPHCSEYFIPRFKCLKWEKPKSADGRDLKSTATLAKNTAHIDCPRCGCEITDDSKPGMNERGVYVAPGQSITPDGVVLGPVPESVTISFWVSGLASPFQTWGERAAEYVEAVRSGEAAEIQAVVNGGMGELYAPGSGDVPEWRELEKLKSPEQPYVLGEVPSWVKFLTLACDVQKDRLIFGIRGWGHRSTSCLVQLGELYGNTAEEEVWEDLEEVLLDRYGGHPIRLALIDSGFRPGNPKQVPENRVYSFCQRHARLCRPTKGRDRLQGKPILPKQIEARVNWRGKLETVGIELFHVDTDYFKRTVHERLRWPIGEPGAFYLPDDAPDYYLQQLVSEARIKRPGGKPVWVQRSKENHFFDIEAMQAAAGWFLGAQRITEVKVETAPVEAVAIKKPNKMAAYAAALNR
ncbi:terminase gpA endonuclease subunit [Mesorhizobium sp. M0088]|uniref:terminase gpA endonuclease subunit n=1 Tax=Mesorhizobium sp. M0088 TaxID=2956873 RepID=UPI00333766B7